MQNKYLETKIAAQYGHQLKIHDYNNANILNKSFAKFLFSKDVNPLELYVANNSDAREMLIKAQYKDEKNGNSYQNEINKLDERFIKVTNKEGIEKYILKGIHKDIRYKVEVKDLDYNQFKEIHMTNIKKVFTKAGIKYDNWLYVPSINIQTEFDMNFEEWTKTSIKTRRNLLKSKIKEKSLDTTTGEENKWYNSIIDATISMAKDNLEKTIKVWNEDWSNNYSEQFHHYSSEDKLEAFVDYLEEKKRLWI